MGYDIVDPSVKGYDVVDPSMKGYDVVEPAQPQIQQLNPTGGHQDHLEASPTGWYDKLAGIAPSVFGPPGLQDPNVPPKGLIPTLGNLILGSPAQRGVPGNPGLLNFSPAELVGPQSTYVGELGKQALSQVNLENLGLLKGLGLLHQATGPAATLAKAAIASHFGIEGTKMASEAIGERTAGVPLSPERKAELDFNVGLGGLMAGSPLLAAHGTGDRPSGLGPGDIQSTYQWGDRVPPIPTGYDADVRGLGIARRVVEAPRDQVVKQAEQAPTILGRPIDFRDPVIDPRVGQPSGLPIEPGGDATRRVERPDGGPAQGGQISFAGQGVPSAGQGAEMLPGEAVPKSGPDIANKLGVKFAQWDPNLPSPIGGSQSFTPPDTGATIEGVQPGTPIEEVQRRLAEKEASGAWEGKKYGKGIGGGIQAAIDKNKQAGAARLPGGEIDPEELAKLKDTAKVVKDELPLGVASIRDREKELRGNFVLSTPRFLVSPKESGFSKIDSPVNVEQLINRTKNKHVSESKALDDMGVFDKIRQAAKDGKISPEDAAKVIQENGPRVEVHTYGMEAKNEGANRRRVDLLVHELDTLGYSIEPHEVDGSAILLDRHGERISLEKAPQRVQEVFSELSSIPYSSETLEFSDGPVATSAYSSVSPKDVKQFPLQRVDVTVPQRDYNQPHKYPAMWPPDQIHEQLPNTLGWAAYQDLPHEKYGEVRNVVEVQSRWGQHQREIEKKVKQGEDQNDSGFYSDRSVPHPLLRDYNRLILKSFIEQAKKDGKRYVSIPDAETAMMSEGHDLQQNLPQHVLDDLQSQRSQGLITPNQYHEALARMRQEERPPQEKGMRLNYDTILPKIMEELTGVKGERAELGEHKNAYDKAGSQVGFDPIEDNLPRKNLIFHNPDGTPKTSTTGLVYGLSKVSSPDLGKVSLFEKDTPESRSGRLYMNPVGEFLRALSPERLKIAGDTFKDAGKVVSDWWDKQESINAKDLADKIFAAGQARQLDESIKFRPQPGEKIGVQEKTLNGLKAFGDLVSKGDKLTNPSDVIFDYLDKGRAKFAGTLMQNIRKPLNEAYNAETNLKNMVLDPVIALKKEGKLNKQNGERIGVYMDTLQKGGRERLIASGVKPEVIDSIVKTLSPEEKSVAQLMRKSYDATFPMVEATAKRLGIELEKVDNYSPWQRDYQQFRPEPDKLSGPKSSEKATEDMVSWLEQNYKKKGTKTEQGFTVDRKPNAESPIKTDAFEIFDKHIRDVAHFVTSQAPLNEMAKVVRDSKFAEKYGKQGQDLMIDWLNTYARQGRRGSEYPTIDAFMDGMRKKVAIGELAFRVSSQLIHLTNLPLVIGRTGPVWFKRGLEAAISNPEFLKRNFAETFERGGSEPALVEATRGPITEVGFGAQRFIDKWLAQATTMGVYLRKLSEQGKDWQNYANLPADGEAVHQAGVMSRRAVASPLYKDVPLALTKGPISKLFFQFQNTPLDQWSNLRYDAVERGLGKDYKGAAGLLVAIASMLVLDAGLKVGVKHALNNAVGYKPKQDDNEMGKKLLDETLRRIPGVSQATSFASHGNSGIPAFDTMREAAGSMKDYLTANDGNDKKLAGARAATTVAASLGIPGAGQAGQLVQNAMKAKYFKSHRTQLEEYAQKNKLDLKNFDQRVTAEEGLKAERLPQTEEQKVAGMKGYENRMLERRKVVVQQVDSNDQNWLKQRGIEIPGWADFVQDSKQRVTLTDEENKKLEDLVLKEYQDVIADLRKDKDFASTKVAQEDKEYANREFRRASKRARSDLKDLMEK